MPNAHHERTAARKQKDRPKKSPTGLAVRLLRSYCNRGRETKQLRSLLVSGKKSTTPVKRAAPPKPAPKRLTVEQNAQIVADYEAGMKIRPIARKYSLNESTIHHRLMRAGVVKRPNSMNNSEIALVLALRADGLSYDRIAERVRFSATTIRNMLKRI